MEFDKFSHLGVWAISRFKHAAYRLGTDQKEIHVMEGGRRLYTVDDTMANRILLNDKKIPIYNDAHGHAPNNFMEKPALEMFLTRFRIKKFV